VKFTERGGVRVAATVQPGGGADGLVIVVEVEDSGCGIAPDEMERIFEIFEQVQSDRAISTGVGLGLPLSRRYARAMGGDVTAASKPGGGSRFRFWFSAQVAAGGQPAGRGEVRQVAPGQPARHLLVVDDEAENRAMLIDLLTTAGFTVKTADTAELALDRLAEAGGVDLVLMDKRLPGMDGYQAIGRLRELPATRDLPVVVVTASGAADEQDLARAAGADGYLAKPVQRDRLLAEIGRLTGVEYVYVEPPAVHRLCTRLSGWIWLWKARVFAGDQGDGGPVVVGGHRAAEVGGGEVFGLGMAREPFAADAVGHPREHGVEAQRHGVAQTAAVVMARGVEPGVQAGFHAPVVNVGCQPLFRRHFRSRPTGHQADGFGLAPGALAVQPGDLRGAGKQQFLAGDRRAHQAAGHPLAFLFLAGVAGGAAGVFFQGKRGEPGSGSRASMRSLMAGQLSLMVSA
jgi:CheY-like chemotaxis protein